MTWIFLPSISPRKHDLGGRRLLEGERGLPASARDLVEFHALFRQIKLDLIALNGAVAGKDGHEVVSFKGHAPPAGVVREYRRTRLAVNDKFIHVVNAEKRRRRRAVTGLRISLMALV